MKYRNNICIIILFFICIDVAAQQKTIMPVSPLRAADDQIERIKSVIGTTMNPVEYPMQGYYHRPALVNNSLSLPRFADTTPPSPPSGLIATTSGITSAYVRFNPSVDPESGITYYAFAIGTAPGLSDIRYWQSLGAATSTPSFSLKSLGIAEGSVFYFTVYAVNGSGLQSNYASSPPVTMNWQNFGDSTNNVTIQFAATGFSTDGVTPITGWSVAQVNIYNHFISRMVPIIKEVYGPPSRSHVITLVRNLYYSGSNIYFPGSNEIHKDDSFHPQLLTHELLHAFRDDIILAMDSNWSYSTKLSGFEESFAQGASYACMNRYVQLYPNDTVVDPASLFGSSMDWDYDYRNIHNLTTEDFWSDYGGMNLHWERYEMGAAAMRKMQLEDSLFYKKFNNAYYAYLNAHHQAAPTRNLAVNLIAAVLPQVEGSATLNWLDKQRIFDCVISPGKKIWVRTQHYPWSEYLVFQYIYHYETFSNGSDWAYYDAGIPSWVYYNMNGSTGTASIFKHSGSLFGLKNLLISGNPGGFGNSQLNFSTDNDLLPWPTGDTANYILNMTQFGVYKLTASFNTTKDSAYRVMGSTLRNTTGVFGGILNSKGGSLYMDHEGYALEAPVNIMNGAFHATRSWASVPNPVTGGTDSKPGKVTFRYTDSLGVVYRAHRNIDWGSSLGNQNFLLDVNEMETCGTVEIFNNNTDDDCDGIKDEASPVTINLKLFIEGLYQGNETMNAAISNGGTGNNPLIADSLMLELHSSLPPYSMTHQLMGLIDIHGNAVFTLPATTNNNSYYLVVKHRTSIETWSKFPVLIDRSVIIYTFSGD